MNEWKRSGKIPAFGNWDDFTNELPITRYFECAREAGLVRYSSSSAETGNISHSNKPLPLPNHNKQERRKRERRVNNKMKKGKGGNGKVCDARKPVRVSKTKSKQLQQNDTVPKPVDEDLYEIPLELIHKTNIRKKMLGFISNCLVPAACLS